jgi:CheY-like chemotaxis protein
MLCKRALPGDSNLGTQTRTPEPRYAHRTRYGRRCWPGTTPTTSSRLNLRPTAMTPKRILVVDDNRIILKAVTMKLQAWGYEVITAEEGGSAVSAARHQRPDLILLDVNFPMDAGFGGSVAWDGFLIMDWLKRIDEAKGIPVIIITADENESYRDRALAAGAAGFFLKPIDPDALLATIRQTLGEDPAAPPAEA